MPPGTSVFVLSGVLDTEHAAQLQELLATTTAGRIVLDLKDITLVDRPPCDFSRALKWREPRSSTAPSTCAVGSRRRTTAGDPRTTPRHRALFRRTDMSVSALPMRIGRDHRDGQLVESLRLRDADAAERLVTTYQSRVYCLAMGITGNAEDAEEVVQDAFWKAIRKIDTFRGESAFGSWLYRIVANAAFQKARRRPGQRLELPLDEVLPAFGAHGRHATAVVDWSAAVDDPCRRTEIRLAVSSALEELPTQYRAPLVLRDVEGWSCAEIGEALSLNVGAVKTRVHRARLFIRNRLADSLPHPGGRGSCEGADRGVLKR
jgi:RNA polymerase sigma-70 factor, ECF subfamily